MLIFEAAKGNADSSLRAKRSNDRVGPRRQEKARNQIARKPLESLKTAKFVNFGLNDFKGLPGAKRNKNALFAKFSFRLRNFYFADGPTEGGIQTLSCPRKRASSARAAACGLRAAPRIPTERRAWHIGYSLARV
jgi:hypothetical protein